MANVYVRSGATGGGTGADWTNAYTTLSAALTAKAAGDVFWVADDHAESTAGAVTLTSPGTEANPCRIFCVNRAGSVPPVAADLRTTATVTTTGASALIMAGSVSECYGITFNCGTGSSQANLTCDNTSGRTWRYVNCALRCLTTATATRLIAKGFWENTTVQFGAVAQGIQLSSFAKLVWKNTPSAITGATIPNVVFPSLGQGTMFVEAVDFSALISGRNLVTLLPQGGIGVFKGCKLSSAAGIFTGTGGLNGTDLTFINCSTGSTIYRTERYNQLGQHTLDPTIVRTGGATDGTTPIAMKITTYTDCRKDIPFETLPITIWNDTTGSAKTVTLECIWGGGAVPNNDDIWMDVEYFGTSGSSLLSKASNGRATPLTSGASLPAGSGTWNGSTTKFALSVTITPAEKGPISIYVRAALASTTFYVDPKPVVT